VIPSLRSRKKRPSEAIQVYVLRPCTQTIGAGDRISLLMLILPDRELFSGSHEPSCGIDRPRKQIVRVIARRATIALPNRCQSLVLRPPKNMSYSYENVLAQQAGIDVSSGGAETHVFQRLKARESGSVAYECNNACVNHHLRNNMWRKRRHPSAAAVRAAGTRSDLHPR
jgi:hypothetical protein